MINLFTRTKINLNMSDEIVLNINWYTHTHILCFKNEVKKKLKLFNIFFRKSKKFNFARIYFCYSLCFMYVKLHKDSTAASKVYNFCLASFC